MATKEPTARVEDWIPPDFGRPRGPRRRPAERPVAPKSAARVRKLPAKRSGAANGKAVAAGGSAGPRSDPERKRLEEECKRADERTRAAEARARRAERELERLRRQLAAAPSKAAPRKPASRSRAKTKPAAGTEGSAPIDLNAATFEGLRALGLSVTQSARLISQREQMGGFRSLEDLDRLYGLPRSTVASLRESCKV